MSIVSKSSAYPVSVQSGIPSLPPTPSGWNRAPMSKYLRSAARPLVMKDDEAYRLVTVKRSRGGVVLREKLNGRDISVKSQFEIKHGDFLISKRQIVHGACGLVPAALDGSIVSNEYSILRGNDKICLEFLNYLANSVYFQQTCFHSSIGVHIEKMIFKLERWLKWDFNIPPLAEQKRIAEILSTWDRAIERTEKLIANSEAQKKALMQQLLTGKKRLPGFSREWKKTKLGNLGRLLKGAGVSRDDVQEAGFPAIRYGEIYTTHHYFIEEFQSFISPETAASSTPLRNGDILFTCSGETAEEIGKSVAFVGADKAFAGGDIIILRDHKQSPRFLGYALNSPDLIRQKTRFGQGNSVVHINARNLAELTLDLPEFSEQEAIGKALDAAKNALIRLRLRLEKLRTEKSALMQQLLTGKRRVKIKGEAQAA